MTEGETEKNWLMSTLLSDLPPTSPEYLISMENERLSQKHYAAVGRVASEWSNLEVFVDYFALKIAKVEEQFGVCLTAQISGIYRKLEAYTAIVRLQTGDVFVPRINKFSELARGLAERRNRIVHDPWIIDEGIPRRYEVSARKVQTTNGPRLNISTH